MHVNMKINQPQGADFVSEQAKIVSTKHAAQVPLVTLLQELIVCQGQVSNCSCRHMLQQFSWQESRCLPFALLLQKLCSTLCSRALYGVLSGIAVQP